MLALLDAVRAGAVALGEADKVGWRRTPPPRARHSACRDAGRSPVGDRQDSELPHTFRHSLAPVSGEHGYDIRNVQELIGHQM